MDSRQQEVPRREPQMQKKQKEEDAQILTWNKGFKRD